MKTVYIEPLPRGDSAGDAPIIGYAVEARGCVLQTFDTQQQAVEWSKGRGYEVYIALVRHTVKDQADHWRKV
jgi:hypothetical protein